MATELRETGISVVGDVPWGTHFCYFYETTQDLLDTLVPYFMAGLKSKEFCLWIISNSELLTLEEATNALRQALPNLDRYVAERSIEVVAHDDWFLNGGNFDLHKVANRFKEKLNEVLARGYAGMRVNGSPAWIYKDDDKELVRFEEELDKLFPDLPVIASCTYPIADSAAGELLNVARTHQFVITRRRGNWEILETPELMQTKAELKKLSEELEQRVIERTRELTAANEALGRRIVQHQQAENRVRLIIDTIPTMAWSLRPDGAVDFINQRWLDYSGLSLEEEIAEPTSTIHPDDLRGVIEKWRVDMAAGELSEQEMRLRRADGKYRWFLVRTAPLRDESGKIIKWYGVSTDIDDRKRAVEQLKATSKQLRALSANLQAVREEEATRIAREIHDELGAALSSLRWNLEDVEEAVSESRDESQLQALREKIEAMLRLIDTTINTVRRIASELRPIALDDLGLVEAIEWQAHQFQDRTGIIVQCDCTMENLDLSRVQSTAAFRILQEALTNILRHAQATRVHIQMNEADGEFILTISDNGRGITDDEKSGQRTLGLLGMRERAHLIGGKVDIIGSEEKGTVVTVRIPTSG